MFVILGAGYTGSRVAHLLRARGQRVVALRSAEFRLDDPGAHQTLREALQPGARILHSIPVLRTPSGYKATMPALAPLFTGRAARLVYLSTTGVYGDAFEVNESTPVAPRHRREVLRTEEEQAVLAGPWKGIVLRPAAIYGPGRGIHESMKEGTYRLMGDGSNFISRIHVDDLAALAEAALYSDLEGAYAAADAEPCPAREIAEFCSRLLDLPMPPGVGSLPADDTRRSNRRVDGGRILALLGISLRYPSYRTGIPASLTQTT